MSDNFGNMPGSCGSRNHLIQPTNIVISEAGMADTIKIVIIA
jgi:hypothetical protein